MQGIMRSVTKGALVAAKTLASCCLIMAWSALREWAYANAALDMTSKHLLGGVLLGVVVLLVWRLRVQP